MSNGKRYYLDTNVIYAISSKLGNINSNNVAVSLLVLWEILSGVTNQSTFQRRKPVVEKLRRSKVRVYPYLPVECLAIAFKVDLSEIGSIPNQKEEIFKQMNIICISKDYEEYIDNLHQEDIDIASIMENEKKQESFIRESLNIENKQQQIELKLQKQRRDEKTEYYVTNTDDLFLDTRDEYQIYEPILQEILDVCNFSYTVDEFKKCLNAYDGSLTAYLLGVNLYAFERGRHGDQVHRNDYTDIKHLLYLRSENDIIVSNDTIYTKLALPHQHMKVDEFEKIFGL
ncbi:hypothetical protein [uncultured Brevibacillus sp.]|uniref:hypothetical protein n=1 Tax=uncultured Brevibacillus sp. TaxID=169970 RepID=UPI002595A422|nr:hypothetical protein [uncultured Brevibacillus sp.]